MTEIETLTEQERSAIRDWIGGRDIVDLVHGLKCEAAELRAALDRSTDDHGDVCKELHATKAKLRALEAKETTRNEARLAELASGTVSRTEYEAMVAQRDTMRKEMNDARWLLADTLPWLKTYDEKDAEDLDQLISAIEALPPARR